MTADLFVLQVAEIEADHLRGLLAQFRDLLGTAPRAGDDPALRRLAPDAYRDDADAAQEFHSLTDDDLLQRRKDDIDLMSESLTSAETTRMDDETILTVTLDPQGVSAWLRSLAALRLVLAERLDITDDAGAGDDPRYGVYEWLGYRLESILAALEG